MKPDLVIGICGKRHHGKDTFAAILAKEFDFQLLPFALTLKDYLEEHYKISNDLLHGPHKRDELFEEPFIPTNQMVEDLLNEVSQVYTFSQEKRQQLHKRLQEKPYKTAREILDHVGTDVFRRELSDRFMIDITQARMQKSRVVLPDARTPLERQTIKDEWGGLLIFVERLNYENEEHDHLVHKELGSPEEYDYYFKFASREENEQAARDLAATLLNK